MVGVDVLLSCATKINPGPLYLSNYPHAGLELTKADIGGEDFKGLVGELFGGYLVRLPQRIK